MTMKIPFNIRTHNWMSTLKSLREVNTHHLMRFDLNLLICFNRRRLEDLRGELRIKSNTRQ